MPVDIDSPASVIARVLDVRGMLLRVGFKEYVDKRTETLYRLHVPLPDGGIPATHHCRHISHALLSLTYTADAIDDTSRFGCRGDARVNVAFGYPVRHLRRNKIIESFNHLSTHDFTEHRNLYSDTDLRELEALLRRIIAGIGKLCPARLPSPKDKALSHAVRELFNDKRAAAAALAAAVVVDMENENPLKADWHLKTDWDASSSAFQYLPSRQDASTRRRRERCWY